MPDCQSAHLFRYEIMSPDVKKFAAGPASTCPQDLHEQLLQVCSGMPAEYSMYTQKDSFQ